MSTRVHVDPDDDQSLELWTALGDLAADLPGEWVLIGGLMVQLHALEHGVSDVRVTQDIDLLAQARPPGALPRLTATLLELGFVAEGPDLDGYAHRFTRGGLVLDVLAPDGIKPPPTLRGSQKAISVPGGSQALSRSEEVEVLVGDRRFALRRPTLLGAILIKARALMVHADPEAQREDLLRLLALVGDPGAMAEGLTNNERKWLRTAEERLAFDEPTRLGDVTSRLAALTFRRLTSRPD